MFDFDIYHRTYDLTSWAPWVMTNFELIAFWAAVLGVAVHVARDMMKGKKASGGKQ